MTNSIHFTQTSWDMIRAGSLDEVEIETEKVILKSSQKAELISKIDRIARSLKNLLDCNDPQLISGIMKYIERFDCMKTTGQLASTMHTFGTHRKANSTLSIGVRRWGK